MSHNNPGIYFLTLVAFAACDRTTMRWKDLLKIPFFLSTVFCFRHPTIDRHSDCSLFRFHGWFGFVEKAILGGFETIWRYEQQPGRQNFSQSLGLFSTRCKLFLKNVQKSLLCWSRHFERALNDEFSVKFWMFVLIYNMAFPVMEFSRQGYKIRKVFG